MNSVLVVDDHEVTRRGVRELLLDANPGVEFEEASDGAALARLLPTRAWSLVVLDAMLPDASLLETLALIRGGSAVPVLVLTAAVELEFVIQSMKAGANGLIHKHRASQDLVEAARCVAAGGTWLHPETAGQVAAALREPPQTLATHDLSGRELEIFKRIALGQTIKEIAGELALSDKTVATYLTRIREKTGLQSHVEIARYALKHQLVD